MKKFAALFMIIPFLLFCALPVSAAEKEERAWQDESIYFIMVDRFMNGDASNDYDVNPDDPKAYHGGDLQGIIDKLDYIKDMGFTTIWLTPIMDNQKKGYHGYWIKDFKAVDEHFGTMEDAKRLVKEAHKRDMKVLFDFVVNHTGDQHPWVSDPAKKDWYHEEQPIMGDSQDQLENGWLSGLPDLNTENPEVKNYLFDAADYWINQTDVDGFRLDTVKHVPKKFWSEFAAHVKETKKNFFLLGEVWSEDPSYIADYEKTGIDSFVNYPFYKEASTTFSDAGNSLNELYTVWERSQNYFKSPKVLGNFLDNHDNVRFTHLAVQNKKNPVTRLKLGLTYMFTSPGIPIVYYGTEVPLDGGEDPDNRKMMDFKSSDDDLTKLLDKLNAMKKQYPALTKGDFKELYNEEGFAIFKRTYKDNTMIISINNDTKTRAESLKDLPDNQQLRGLLLDGIVRQSKDGSYKLGMDRETADVFVVEEDEGYNWLFIGFVGGVLGLFVFAVTFISIKNKKTTAEQ